MVHADGGTLTGRAPAARIFALVILSLVVLLGSLLAVSAIGGHDDSRSTVGAKPTTATRDSNGVLVVPKDEPKPKPKPAAKPRTERKKAAPVVTSSASSTPAPAASTATPTPTPAPAPVQSAPAPAPTPAPAPAPAAKPAPQKQAPVQHRVVVTE